MTSVLPETLPRRRFIAVDVGPSPGLLDEHGFLADTFMDKALGVTDLFPHSAVLVVAPPWTGKTYVAERLDHHFRENRARHTKTNPFGRLVHATLFQQFGRGAHVHPDWWKRWMRSKQRACWIVDALDEDARRHDNRMHEILDGIRGLRADARERLCLLMFCRESEKPAKVIERLDGLYPGDADAGSLLTVRLAPLDRRSARDLLGSQEKFDTACQSIQANQLQAVSGYPSVLEEIDRQGTDSGLSVGEVWRAVLKRMLYDPRREREPGHHLPPIEDRFHATARIAAALTFSGHREVDAGLGESRGPSVAQLFPGYVPRSDFSLAAARAALTSAAFQRTSTGYRFAQHHVQEWFTAFELEKTPLSKVRPLLADGAEKPFDRHQGIHGLLCKMSAQADVRDWIIESHGGVPPRSDAAPWPLAQSLPVLDRLQQLARTSEHGLTLWRDRGLENIAAPGLGRVLARRVADRNLTVAEREFLLEVARATRARRVAPVAERIVADSTDDIRIRLAAAYLLHDVGEDAHFRRLESFVTTTTPQSQEHRQLVAVIVRELYRRGLWTFEQALQHAPAPTPGWTDATAMLEHVLKEDMKLEDARRLLRRIDWKTFGSEGLRGVRRPRARRSGPLSFVLRAVELVARQDTLPQSDYQLLQPIVLLQQRTSGVSEEIPPLAELFRQDRDARRRLFLAGLKQATGAADSLHSEWRWVLTGEDLDWLVHVAEEGARDSPWLWEHLLSRTYHDDVQRSDGLRIRRHVRSYAPAIVAAFDKQRRRHLRRQKRFQATIERTRRERTIEQFGLNDAIGDTLSRPGLRIRERLHRLSWLCFAEDPVRPENVVGKWEDLPDPLKRAVIATCEKALHDCTPTRIPDEAAFPGGIVYESRAFVEVLRQSDTYTLDGEQIRKWLPATVFLTIPDNTEALARCMDADRAATDDVILGAIRRDLRLKKGTGHTAANLPAEHWSERLVERAQKLVQDGRYGLKGRCELLKVLGAHAPASVVELAKSWLKYRKGSAVERRTKRRTAIDVLLPVLPEVAVPELARDFAKRGRQVLLEMDSLVRSYGGLPTKIGSWNAADLEKLAVLFHDAFPSDTDPTHSPGDVWWGSPEGDLRQFRDHLTIALFERGSPEDVAALERLSEKYPAIGRWYAWAKANRDASGVLRYARVPPSAAPLEEGAVPVSRVVRLLDDAAYRLIRSDGDLQRVLIEVLREIGDTAKAHLHMLYRPAERSADKRTKARRRLHEGALQAYLHCRLTDLLRNRVLEPGTQVTFIDRESLATRAQRLDLKIQAPTVDAQAATVIIEVKWSDNKQVSWSQIEQLGKDYLMDQGLTRGIYFVGWYRPGPWSVTKALGTPPGPRDSIEAWRKALADQALEFAKTRPGVEIEPLVVDLQWEKPD